MSLRTRATKLRLWVVGPFLFYLFVFLLWFPRWQNAPHAYSTRLLGFVFGGMTAILAVLAIIGGFFVPFGKAGIVGDILDIAIRFYETFIAKDSTESAVHASNRRASLLSGERPPLVVTKRLKDGTPVRGACPLCDVEFSTEAFDRDRTYPHANTLDRWYAEHFASHIEES